jgi:hypothetical protein
MSAASTLMILSDTLDTYLSIRDEHEKETISNCASLEDYFVADLANLRTLPS